MQSIIKEYTPDNWDNRSNSEENAVASYSGEFQNVQKEVEQAVSPHHFSIRSMKRIQNIYTFGQLLLREQLLVLNNPNSNYYRVRRFVAVNRNDLHSALKYNLDHRRCTSSSGFSFSKRVTFNPSSQVLLAVQVVTESPNNSTITPKNFLEYYIEYVIELEY